MLNLLKRNNSLIFYLFLVVTILLLSILYNLHNKIVFKDNQIAALSDTLTVYKTKEGKNAAYISVLTGSKNELLSILKKKDKENYNLIKKTPGIQTLTNLGTITRIDTITKLDTIIIKDTDKNPSTPDSIYITKNITNKYYEADIKIIQDSLAFKLSVVNDFKIMTRYKNNGFLKSKSLIVDVVNNNPYTITTGLTSFNIVKSRSNTGFKIGLGLGIAAGTYLLLK